MITELPVHVGSQFVFLLPTVHSIGQVLEYKHPTGHLFIELLRLQSNGHGPVSVFLKRHLISKSVKSFGPMRKPGEKI